MDTLENTSGVAVRLSISRDIIGDGDLVAYLDNGRCVGIWKYRSYVPTQFTGY